MCAVKKPSKTKKIKQDNQASYSFPEERYDLKILQALRKIIQAVDLHSRKLSIHHEITAPQLVTLLTIAEHGPMTIAAISKKIHLSSSTLVGIIDRLESKGLVQRKRDTLDRRKIFIEITKKGKSFCIKAPSPLQERLARSLEKLTHLEKSTIALSLERVVKLMEADDIEAAPMLESGAINKATN